MASIRVKFDSSNGLQVSGLTISWCRRGLLGKLDPGGGGGGGWVGTPCDGIYEEVPPERGTFFRLEVYKRVGISRVEV